MLFDFQVNNMVKDTNLARRLKIFRFKRELLLCLNFAVNRLFCHEILRYAACEQKTK